MVERFRIEFARHTPDSIAFDVILTILVQKVTTTVKEIIFIEMLAVIFTDMFKFFYWNQTE